MSSKPKPFHILLLAGGNRSLNKGNKPIHDGYDDGDFDEYLRRRNEFRKKAACRHPKADIAKGDSSVTDRGDCVNAGKSSLHTVASPLEIAMAACCEHGGPREGGDCVPTPKGATNNAGILQSGKEGHFLKLLLMFCPKHAAGHRALALAILQRTVSWEASNNISHSKLATASTSKNGLGATSGDDQNIHKTFVSNTDVKKKTHIHAERTMIFLKTGGMKLLARWLTDSFTVIPPPPTTLKRQGNHISTQHTTSPTGFLLLPLLQLLNCIPFKKNLVVESQIHKSIKRLKKALDKLVKGLNPNTWEKAVHPIAGGLSVGKVVEAVDIIMASWGKAAAVESTSTNVADPKADPHQQLQNKIQLRFGELARFQNEGGDAPAWLSKSILGMWRATTSQRVKSKIPIYPLQACSISTTIRKQPTTSHLRKPENPSNSLHASSVPATHPKDLNSNSSSSSGRQVKLLQPLIAMGQNNNKKEGLYCGKRKGAVIMLPETPKSEKMQKQETQNSSRRVTWADRPTSTSIFPRPLKEERLFVKDETVAQEWPTAKGANGENKSDEDDSDMEDLF